MHLYINVTSFIGIGNGLQKPAQPQPIKMPTTTQIVGSVGQEAYCSHRQLKLQFNVHRLTRAGVVAEQMSGVAEQIRDAGPNIIALHAVPIGS